jgi:hypothetical protein
MTWTKRTLEARRRGELTHDRGLRRLDPAIDARRRLNALLAEGTQTEEDPRGPSELRYAYLTQSHD